MFIPKLALVFLCFLLMLLHVYTNIMLHQATDLYENLKGYIIPYI